jgi:hypothetical protein
MNMFGHGDVPGLRTVAAEGEEVGLPGLVESSQTAGHEEKPTPVPLPTTVRPRAAPKKTWARSGQLSRRVMPHRC